MHDTGSLRRAREFGDQGMAAIAAGLVAKFGKQDAGRIATNQARQVSGSALMTWVSIRKLIDQT